MPLAFLSARWSNLILITYAFDPAVLDPLLPPGCVADVVDGRAFASIVAFDFLDTRVLGVRWPGFVNFPEVNLRIYVRDEHGRRGVSFVREFVPQRFVAWMARTLYGEPYRSVSMRSSVSLGDGTIDVQHAFELGGREQSIRAVGRTPAIASAAGGVEDFFKEHDCGFGRTRRGKRLTYRVAHDPWAIYPVERFEIRCDFERAYGPRWAFLADATPHHVMLARGGPVRVYPWHGGPTIAAPAPA